MTAGDVCEMSLKFCPPFDISLSKAKVVQSDFKNSTEFVEICTLCTLALCKLFCFLLSSSSPGSYPA